MHLKKILIITDALTQPLYHPRVRNIYHYLKSNDVQVDWIAEKYDDIPTEFNLNVRTIPFYKYKGLTGKIEWLIKNILNLLFDYKNTYFSNKVLKETEGQNYDLVFCSTFHTFGLKASWTISDNKNIPLFIDLRDIAEQCDLNEYTNSKIKISPKCIASYYRKINIKRRNKILKLADCITTVSPWHADYIRNINTNVHLIYNGYDQTLFAPKNNPTSYFDIVYTGKWYSQNLQDPTLLFEALSNINIPEIRLIWYTNDDVHQRIKDLANQFKLANKIIINSYVPNKEIPQILNSSSIIIVLTNKGNHGILTTKFYEALGVEKPILCVRSDEESLAKVIKETGCGLAATNAEEVKEFILKYYKQWQEQGYTHVAVNNKEQFTRQRQAIQFEELFNSLIENK